VQNCQQIRNIDDKLKAYESGLRFSESIGNTSQLVFRAMPNIASLHTALFI